MLRMRNPLPSSARTQVPAYMSVIQKNYEFCMTWTVGGLEGQGSGDFMKI